ncbi:MAG: hypothetical protein AB1529_01735 [Candidatus Micrarchaeota archaeon]
MADHKALWDRVRGWYHFPPLKEPRVVKDLDGGACFDFRRKETLVDEGFVQTVSGRGGMSEEKCLEGVFAHEIGHYMVFPRDLGTCVLAGKMIDDFFDKLSLEVRSFIFQTYADMANDTASVLEEQRTSAILDVRKAMQAVMDDPINRNVRQVMLAYLHRQARREFALEDELKPYLEKMMEIDFLAEDTTKLRLGLWTFGNIIADMIKKYGGEKALRPDHSDCDIMEILGKSSEGELREALREISYRISRREYEKVKDWLKKHGAEPPKLPAARSIGTSEGELPVDPEVLEYYRQLSMRYALVVTKKLLETEGTVRSWSDTRKWRPGEDPNLALPQTSGGLYLPGVTKSVRITERPIRTSDYEVPHLLVVIDSSASMPIPKEVKSYAVLGAYCGARSYHLHGSSIGVINFSGSSFYLPYTRDLDAALGAISAYQGGGTIVDVEMLRKMLGPEMAELYASNPERALGHVPREAIRKELELSVPQFTTALAAESIDLLMFTDGGIFNLDEVLALFSEKAELNRATIILTHGFEQALGEIRDPRISVCRIDEEKDIPGIVIRATHGSLSSLSKVIRG